MGEVLRIVVVEVRLKVTLVESHKENGEYDVGARRRGALAKPRQQRSSYVAGGFLP